MSIPIVVAVIALLSAMASAGLSFYFQSRTAERQQEREAAKVLAKYREPLILAAYDLQSRLWNILRKDFLQKYYVEERNEGRQYALEHTLYLVGQYFAWTEILRREVQFLQFEEEEETRRIVLLQQRIRATFADDDRKLGTSFMIFRGEQNAIGERMVTTEEGQRVCIGYATFVEKAGDQQFRRWFERLARDVDAVAAERNPRLRLLQNQLVELVIALDEGGMRFQESIDKA